MLGYSFFLTNFVHAASFHSNINPYLKVVSIYLPLDTQEQLHHYMSDLTRIKKPNFNRIIFAFVKPTLDKYETGSLANTGILGYYHDHDGKGVLAFNALKAAINLSKEKNIQTFLAVGGSSYSCNFDLAKEACGSSSVFNNTFYDWFPDPIEQEDSSKTKISYENIIKLANDLGVEGINIDYEEVWHADKYAIHWGPSSRGEWSTDIAQNILRAGGPTYDILMKYGTSYGFSYVMPKTVDKLDSILHALIDNPEAKYLKFAATVPPLGARPITGFMVHEDNVSNRYTRGGLWWKGNLKGLWYNLVDKDKAIVSHFDSFGLKSYDLCADKPNQYHPYVNGLLNLSDQVDAYMKDYINWLKSDNPRKPILKIDKIGKVTFLPAKYHINPTIQFGFEVSQTAYSKNIKGQLQLTNRLVDKILDDQKGCGGVMIWHMYSKQNTAIPGATTVKYTINQSCKTFLRNDNRYECNIDFPSSVK